MLKLKFKDIAPETKKFMEKAVYSDEDYYKKAVHRIQDFMGGEEIHILNSANSCLLTVAKSIADPILVADEGGWNGFIKSCELFSKNVEYIQTNNGLINIDELSNYLNENTIKSLYITSLAGYTAAQPLKEIWELCNLHDVVLILDISGSVGCRQIENIGDIQVFSTGSPKIVNIENGGVIKNNSKKQELNNHLLKTLRADNITCAGIYNEITKSQEILEKIMTTNRYLKTKLNNALSDNDTHCIIHPTHYGLNTIITTESKSKAKKLAYNIRQQLDIKKNIITTGPNYNRIKKASVTIEIKNLDLECLTTDNMDRLYEIIINEIDRI